MRSSKSRSRSKSNRQRSLGNIINRVFDSSGPEGKVRGTPQQIIDKYLMLARDAHLSNDRVAEQNFLQHAEHYTRLLGEAQREMQREQELRQQQGQHHQGGQNGERGQGGRDRYDQRTDAAEDIGEAPGLDFGTDTDEGPGLVETPETRASVAEERTLPPVTEAGEETDSPAETARRDDGARKERKPRGEGAPRGPRRPREKRGEAAEGGAAPDTSDGKTSAAG